MSGAADFADPRSSSRGGPVTIARPDYLSPFALAFAAALLVDFLTDLWGGDELSVIGSFHLHATDIAAVLAAIMLVKGQYRFDLLNSLRAAVLALSAVAVFALVRGVMVSPHDALIYFRSRGVVLGYLFYTALSSNKKDHISALMPWMVGFVSLYFGLFFLRTVFGPELFLRHDTAAYIGIFELEFRAIDTTTVQFLALVLIFVLDTILKTKDKKNLIWAGLLALIILWSRQRTAGLAGLVGVGVLYFGDSQWPRKYPYGVWIAVGLMTLAAFAWTSGAMSILIRLLPAEFQESWQKTGTFDSRLQIWSFALGWRFVNWDWFRQLFGAPAGEPLDIIVDGVPWIWSLHSEYVTAIMSYGIAGAVSLATMIMAAIKQTTRELDSRRPNRLGISPNVALAWMATIIVSGLTYEWTNTAAIFMALALAGLRPRSRPSSSRSERGRR